MAIGVGSNGSDWDDANEDYEDENISPVGKRSWLEDEDEESNISPVGNADWLEDETDG